MLRVWNDAPAILLSCPVPPRRGHAAVQPLAEFRLPQCLLGGEAQLQAFAASVPDLAGRLFFTPLPEIFTSPASLAALHAAIHTSTGGQAGGPRPVHLRFGGTRSARILKEARNGLVLAENHFNPPITASRHPFASGLTLPAHMRRIFAYDTAIARPATLDGTAPPLTALAVRSVAADLPAGRERDPEAREGLEVISLAEFRSNAWAAGPVRARSPHLRAALDAARQDRAPFVLLPWNLDHPGSIVPSLVERTLRLQSQSAPTLRLLVMPFNYPGQTGLIRRLVRLVRDKAGADALAQLFVGRLTQLEALPDLLALARVAWVDGNDPEYDWTARRLSACGIVPLLLAATDLPPPPGATVVEADEAMTLDVETRFGLLHFRTQLPSLRALRQLLPLTRAEAGRKKEGGSAPRGPTREGVPRTAGSDAPAPY